ncbi:acyl-CoA N-acyltransferase [Zopfia rhizophila CBS 207.26]|uniref:Acyl-CoA N-acyltransferase n=1 Tax=Zopfia rhizophila CBS 207.26 TaxID=1314779 RepID=A0A6A6DMZ1_9PEZI|nr:acyl-CoA N-acyltransferase [Zopfia rhizophila CBS 207.26]
MPVNLRVRPALQREAHALAMVGAVAFLDDPFDAYLYPKRKANLNAYRRLYRQKVDAAIHEPLCWVIVAQIPPESEGVTNGTSTEPSPGPLAGYAIWIRESSEERKNEVRRRLHVAGLHDSGAVLSMATRLKHGLLNSRLAEAVRDLCNPVVDRDRSNAFWKACQDSSEDMDEPEEHWYLQELAVAPMYRRRGVGGALVDWGLDWARKEEIPVLLNSTSMGTSLYQKAGFVQYGVWRWGNAPDMAWTLMQWSPSTCKWGSSTLR